MKRICQLMLAISALGCTAVLAQPVNGKPEKSIDYWVSQLGHEHYLRRELANKKLRDAGPAAVLPLIEVARSGDLEVVEQATSVITTIALANWPQEDGGAWDELSRVAETGGGRRASSARSALREIREYRSLEARKALSAVGIFVGVDEFAIGAISSPETIVEIDEQWQGDTDALQWLAWLQGVRNARVKGKAVRRDVLESVTQIPGLETLVVIDGTVTNEALQPLLKMDRIQSLEFRYVKLSDDQAELIAQIPIRLALNLMGTGISESKVASMGAQLPGLKITHRRGGFLGVSCMDSLREECTISSVVPGSAAEEAGLIQGDVIIGIDDVEVKLFRDLQEAVNLHVPGEEVEVRYRRGKDIQTVKLRLRRLEDS